MRSSEKSLQICQGFAIPEKAGGRFGKKDIPTEGLSSGFQISIPTKCPRIFFVGASLDAHRHRLLFGVLEKSLRLNSKVLR
jgi:hypothetical protein